MKYIYNRKKIKIEQMFEKEMKKRSVAIFNKTPSGEKYKRVPYVKMMLSYTFGKSK